MKQRALIDAGPLSAIFNSRDSAHRTCGRAMSQLQAPLLTCWPVVTEAAWLLRARSDAVTAMLRAFDDGVFQLLELGVGDLDPIADILDRYRDLRPQLADAALVHLAERERIDTVFTLDRRDFSVYRTRRNRSLTIVPSQ